MIITETIMKHLKTTLFGLVAVAFVSAAPWAQNQPTEESDPAAASSPHQREATSTEAQEAAPTRDSDPAASSSPHQRETTRTATGDEESQILSCVQRMRAQNDALSADQARKACEQQMRQQRREGAG
nr:hypothetical protein [Gammaproteobacteria bacterium]